MVKGSLSVNSPVVSIQALGGWAQENRPTQMEFINNNLYYSYMLYDITSYIVV